MENRAAGRPTTVVCPELQVALWKKVRRALGTGSEFMVLQCPAVPAEVLSLCGRLGPSVLLSEPRFAKQFRNTDLIELSRSGRLQVLALAEEPGAVDYDVLLRAGCAGVLESKSPPELYRRAIHAVMQGEIWAPRLVLAQFARESLLAGSARRLTSREAEILHLLALNYKNQDIANQLFISRETVRWHLRSVYSKIGVADRAAAIEYARRSASAGTGTPGT
jgi:DNA-binding NarL/FixJ family response regulator